MAAAPVPDASVPAERLLAEAGFLARLARELVGDAARAEDLVQDTWTAALERPPQDVGSLRAWLATVARNLASNVRRGEGRRARREEAVARAERVEPDGEALERLETSRILVECVLVLPVEQRTVLYLRYYEGLAPAEIADRLGAPLKTIKSRHTRALAALRERLDARARGDRRAWAIALVPLARSWPVVPGDGQLLPVLGGLVMKKTFSAAAVVMLLVLVWFAYERSAGGTRGRTRSERDLSLVTPPPPMAAPLPLDPGGQREARPEAITAGRESAAGRAEITLLWSDGTPAVGVGASMLQAGPRGAPRVCVRAVSDPAGLLRFADLATGRNRLVVDLRASQELDIEPGAVHTSTVTLPAATEVRGFVRGVDGRPLVGAALVFDDNDWGGWTPELEVAVRSAADGSFVLRDVEDGRDVGARAPGCLPSPLVTIAGLPVVDGARRIDFSLEPGAGRLTGRVLAPDGRPLAGARVVAGPRNGHHVTGPHGGHAIAPPPLAARSDEAGRFELEDALPLGPQPVHCMARGFGQWSGSVTIVGGTTEFEIRLEPSARIEGRVVDVEGIPVAGVRVLQSVEHLGGWYLEESFPPPLDVTDAEGWFVLEWVAPGTRELNAFSYERYQLGRARAVVECRAGETIRCELRLELGLTIAGRVVDERGAPLAGWYVGSRPSDFRAQWYPRHSSTGADGSFRLVNLGEGTHDLEVRALGGLSAPRLQVKAVATGTQELELVVPGADEAEGELVGRLVDVAGSALDDIEITLWRVGQNEGHFLELDPQTGIFRGRTFPGEYRLKFRRAGADVVQLQPFEIASNEVTELGDVLFGLCGRLEITLSGFTPERLSALDFHLEREGLGDVPLANERGVLRSSEALAGTWTLVTGERELSLAESEFEVVAGQTTRYSVTVSFQAH